MVQRMFWLGISLAEHLRGDAVDGISREVAFEEIARHSTHHLELQVAGIRVADVAHHLSEKRNRGVFVSRFGKRPAQIVGASEFHHQRVFDANESARVDLLKSCCHLVQPSVNSVGAAGFITRETSHIIFFITRGIKHQRVGCLHMALKKGFPSEGAACEKHLEMGVFRLYQQAADIVEEHERRLVGVLAPGIVDTFIDSIKENRNLHSGTHCLVVKRIKNLCNVFARGIVEHSLQLRFECRRCKIGAAEYEHRLPAIEHRLCPIAQLAGFSLSRLAEHWKQCCFACKKLVERFGQPCALHKQFGIVFLFAIDTPHETLRLESKQC